MANAECPDDCLFVVVEADFRWYRGDCIHASQWLGWSVGDPVHASAKAKPRPNPATDGTFPTGVDLSVGASRPSPSATKLAEARPDADTLGTFKNLWQFAKPYKGAYDYASQEVLDLVVTATQASEKDCGEVVWWSYNADWQKKDGVTVSVALVTAATLSPTHDKQLRHCFMRRTRPAPSIGIFG